MTKIDPSAFNFVPVLQDRIIDPNNSNLRMTYDSIAEWDSWANKTGMANWRYSHEKREDLRKKTLRAHRQTDIWIFAYGSLMWDPGFFFDEVRYAKLDGAHRSFSLSDTIGRGSPDKPGLMVGLELGGHCQGLAFRIGADRADVETEVIWMREMISPGYRAKFQQLCTPQGNIEGLAFLLDHRTANYISNIGIEDAIQRLATGCGPGGTSCDYLEKLVAQLDLLQLNDPSMVELLWSVHHYSKST